MIRSWKKWALSGVVSCIGVAALVSASACSGATGDEDGDVAPSAEEIRNGRSPTEGNAIVPDPGLVWLRGAERAGRVYNGTGFLMCERAVLTAGHVTAGMASPGSGSITTNRTFTATVSRTATLDTRVGRNDLSVLFLRERLPFGGADGSSRGFELARGPQDLPARGGTVQFRGRGQALQLGRLTDPGVVQFGYARFREQELGGWLTFDADPTENQIPCGGDSGGPVLGQGAAADKWRILGVVSGAPNPNMLDTLGLCTSATSFYASSVADNRAWLDPRIDAFCHWSTLLVKVKATGSSVDIGITPGFAENAPMLGSATPSQERSTHELLAHDIVTLTPRANGERFSSWQGENCPCTEEVCTFTAETSKNYECTAVFVAGDDSDDGEGPDAPSPGEPQPLPDVPPADAPPLPPIAPSKDPEVAETIQPADDDDGQPPAPPPPPSDVPPEDAGDYDPYVGICGDGYCNEYELTRTDCVDCWGPPAPSGDEQPAPDASCLDHEEERDGECVPR